MSLSSNRVFNAQKIALFAASRRRHALSRFLDSPFHWMDAHFSISQSNSLSMMGFANSEMRRISVRISDFSSPTQHDDPRKFSGSGISNGRYGPSCASSSSPSGCRVQQSFGRQACESGWATPFTAIRIVVGILVFPSFLAIWRSL